MSALRTGDELVLVGEMRGGHATKRLLERLVAQFAEVCDRRFLRIGCDVGGVQRQIGCSTLTSPLAGAFQQHVCGFVDRRRFRSRRTLQAGIAEEISRQANAEESQQCDRRNKQVANAPNCSDLCGRIDCRHFQHPHQW